MDSNPSSKLKEGLEEDNVFRQEPVLIEHRYSFSRNPPCVANVHPDSHLRYIDYETIEGEFNLGTIQQFESRHDAVRHWETQHKYDATYFIHPVKCLMRQIGDQNMYVLVFPKIITDFNGCWVKIHVKGSDDHSLVTDKDMWTIYKKIGKNLKYLSSEAKSPRPHGNLLHGTGITSDLKALFLNLGDNAADPLLYEEDAKALHGLLSSFKLKPTVTDKAITDYVDKWISFLSDCCVQVKPDFMILQQSLIHPPYLNHNHVKFIFNYPSSWSVKEQLRFLANLYKLCTEKGFCNNQNLGRNKAFKSQLMKCNYSHWNHCFVSGTNKGPLNEVYRFRSSAAYMDGSGKKLDHPTIVLFVGNCIKHYADGAKAYNTRNKYQRGHKDYMEELITAEEILAEIHKEFPHVVENLYVAFYRAIAKGYRHSHWSVEQMLTTYIGEHWT